MNERFIEDFRTHIKKYSEIENLIRRFKEEMFPLQKHIKILSEQKNEIKKKICSFMQNHKIDVCNLPKEFQSNQAAIKYTSVDYAVPMTQKHIREGLNNFFLNEPEEFKHVIPSMKGSYVYKYIQDSRPKEHRQVLRKVKYTNADIVTDEYDIINS